MKHEMDITLDGVVYSVRWKWEGEYDPTTGEYPYPDILEVRDIEYNVITVDDAIMESFGSYICTKCSPSDHDEDFGD